MKVLLEGAVKVGKLGEPVSVRLFRDKEGEEWAEASLQLTSRDTWTVRYQLPDHSLRRTFPVWYVSFVGGMAEVSERRAKDCVPPEYCRAMRTLVFGLARMEFE